MSTLNRQPPTAVVTGATSGLGKEIAHRLQHPAAHRELGAAFGEAVRPPPWLGHSAIPVRRIPLSPLFLNW